MEPRPDRAALLHAAQPRHRPSAAARASARTTTTASSTARAPASRAAVSTFTRHGRNSCRTVGRRRATTGWRSIAYAPNTVTAKVGNRGATATIVQRHRYPFDDEIRFKITMSAPATFPLVLRTPGWCDKPSITINGKPGEAARPAYSAESAANGRLGTNSCSSYPWSCGFAAGCTTARTSIVGRFCTRCRSIMTRTLSGSRARV
jgi:hypothetical protein